MNDSAFLYGLTLSETATCYNFMLAHLIRSHAFHETVSPNHLAGTRKAYRISWCMYVAATLLALVWPLVSFAVYVIMAAYFLLPHGVDADITGPKD
jgi:uncharacterized membrane protein